MCQRSLSKIVNARIWIAFSKIKLEKYSHQNSYLINHEWQMNYNSTTWSISGPYLAKYVSINFFDWDDIYLYLVRDTFSSFCLNICIVIYSSNKVTTQELQVWKAFPNTGYGSLIVCLRKTRIICGPCPKLIFRLGIVLWIFTFCKYNIPSFNF